MLCLSGTAADGAWRGFASKCMHMSAGMHQILQASVPPAAVTCEALNSAVLPPAEVLEVRYW